MGHPHRVLLVEDDRLCRTVVAAVLTTAGCEVVEAENGEDGIAQLRNGVAPCLIVLDLMMPVRDGFWFRAQQLADGALASLPVVVMSAGTGEIIERARQLGLQDYVPKPVAPARLISMLGRCCGRPSEAAARG